LYTDAFNRPSGRIIVVGSLTIRPRWLRPQNVIALIFAVLMVVVGAYYSTLIPLLLGVLVAALAIAGQMIARLEVTTDAVIFRTFPGKGSCRRADVRSVHFFSSAVTFVGADHQRLMRLNAGAFSKAQYLDLAEALGVPMYNHRSKSGLFDIKKGELVQRRDVS
jgi:hypothetical protein